MEASDLAGRLRVAGHGLAFVTAHQAERPLSAGFIPEVLQLDGAEHVTLVPEQGHHLAVQVDRATAGGGPIEQISDHAMECGSVDLPAGGESRQRLAGVQQVEASVANRLRDVHSHSLELGLEDRAVRPRCNCDRYAAGSKPLRQMRRDGRAEVPVVIVELHDMFTAFGYGAMHPVLHLPEAWEPQSPWLPWISEWRPRRPR